MGSFGSLFRWRVRTSMHMLGKPRASANVFSSVLRAVYWAPQIFSRANTDDGVSASHLSTLVCAPRFSLYVNR